MKSLLGLGALLSLFSAARAASAGDYGVWIPEEREDRIGAEFAWLGTGNAKGGTTNLVTIDAFAQIEFNPTLFAIADIPIAITAPAPDPTLFTFGNPLLGLMWSDSIVNHLNLFIGGMVGIPVNNNPDLGGFETAERAGSIRAYEGLARFSPRSLPIVIRTGTRLIFAPFYFRIEATPSIFIPLNPNAKALELPKVGEDFGVRSDFGLQTGSTVIMLDQINDIGIRADFGLHGGVRIQESFVLTGADDIVQFAVEPFIGYESEKKGFIGRLGFLLGLDGQAGFAFDTGKVRTLRLMLGYKFF